ncbi:MAG TPA: hypothetical protein VFZ34_28095 [Blastocatellia bacterium]|nr:hypothetical protein [Blastocatellia bacterium]
MKNLLLAFAALDRVRTELGGFSSDNKRFADPGMNQGLDAQYKGKWDPTTANERIDQRQRQHTQKSVEINTLRGARAPQTAAEVINYGGQVFAKKVGNCLELASAVAWYLHNEERNKIDTCDLVKYVGADHVFVAIGQALPAKNGQYPKDFGAWDDDAAICDVWADIACPAREYPTRWRQRMGNWATMNILLAPPTGYLRVRPTDPAWYDIVNLPKISHILR